MNLPLRRYARHRHGLSLAGCTETSHGACTRHAGAVDRRRASTSPTGDTPGSPAAPAHRASARDVPVLLRPPPLYLLGVDWIPSPASIST
jgi:hypothetical protein